MAFLYALEAALLLAHEVDSAVWHEWELLRFPGGGAAFVLLHVPLALAVVWGLAPVRAGTRRGALAAIGLGVLGIGAAAVHGVLMARGRPEFCSAASVAVLAAGALVAVPLVSRAARVLAEGPARLARAR